MRCAVSHWIEEFGIPRTTPPTSGGVTLATLSRFRLAEAPSFSKAARRSHGKRCALRSPRIAGLIPPTMTRVLLKGRLDEKRKHVQASSS